MDTGRPRAGRLLEARIPALIAEWRKSRGLATRRAASAGLDGRETAAAGAALLALQRGLTGGRSLAGSGYMEDRELLGAYLLYYWPVSYMQLSLALAEHPLSPKRVLDLGSGPGPASAAIVDALPIGQRLEELVLLDGSRRALELGASIIERGPAAPKLIRRVELDLESGAELPRAEPGKAGFDLIVFGHCLNELWAGKSDALERRRDLVQRAAGLLGPHGKILLMEPALLETARSLIALRDALAARSWRVLAPCPASYPCPALAAGPERSCHAQSPWQAPDPVASLARSAGLDRQAVKFAYFLLSPPQGAAPEPVDPGLRRVVSDPMLNKAGRLRYILCGDGRLDTLSARADDPEARARGFMGLRRGDRLRASALEPRQGGGFGLLPESKLVIEAQAPEAAP